MDDMERARTIRETFPALDLIGDPKLRDDIVACWARVWEESPWQALTDCPVNPHIPDTTLVEHINSLAEMALATADIMEKYRPSLDLDRDHLLTGVLLHDVSKLVEIEPTDKGPAFSELNRRMPHSVYGAFVAMAQGLDSRTANIIMGHTRLTGTNPDSPEAVLLHYLDHCSADVIRARQGLPLIMVTGSTFGAK